MSNQSIVLDNPRQIDSQTSHAIAAAQLRAEGTVRDGDPRATVRAIATELEQLGLRPNVPELARRYQAGETRLPTWLRERG